MQTLLHVINITGLAAFLFAAIKLMRLVWRDTVRDWKIARTAKQELRHIALAEYSQVFPRYQYDGIHDDEAGYLQRLRSRCLRNLWQRCLTVALLTILFVVMLHNYALATR